MTADADIAALLGCRDVALTVLDVPVNDVIAVDTDRGRFALKLYHQRRARAVVDEEAALVQHLCALGAPMAPVVPFADGSLVRTITWNGAPRTAVLYEWAPGAKPAPSRETYLLLGATAARIHAAADSFLTPLVRQRYDAAYLIDEQLARMRPLLEQIDRWTEVVAMCDRLRPVIEDPALEWGINHLDLTLDNVHRDGDSMLAFDFDSSAESWRAFEPYGVRIFSTAYLSDWLEGYRAVRPFGERDEAAIDAFAVVGDLRVVNWKLGLAESSRGEPLLDVDGLDAVVDEWLALAPA
jgi:Ser/Thr protein kinase RdoA (MazF antagonist)